MTDDLDALFERVDLLARHDPHHHIVGPGVIEWLRAASQLHDFHDAFDRWFDSACVAWAVAYATSKVPTDVEPRLVAEVRPSIQRLLTAQANASTWVHLDALHAARAALALAADDVAEARDSSAWLEVIEPAPQPLLAWIRVECAARAGDVTVWLAAADEGLATGGLSAALRGTLLDHRARALEASQRWVDALDARIAYCEHCDWDIPSWLLVAYLRVLVADYDGAAQWIRRLAYRNSKEYPLRYTTDRLNWVARPVTDALARTGAADDLVQFQAALDRVSSGL